MKKTPYNVATKQNATKRKKASAKEKAEQAAIAKVGRTLKKKFGNSTGLVATDWANGQKGYSTNLNGIQLELVETTDGQWNLRLSPTAWLTEMFEVAGIKLKYRKISDRKQADRKRVDRGGKKKPEFPTMLKKKPAVKKSGSHNANKEVKKSGSHNVKKDAKKSGSHKTKRNYSQ